MVGRGGIWDGRLDTGHPWASRLLFKNVAFGQTAQFGLLALAVHDPADNARNVSQGFQAATDHHPPTDGPDTGAEPTPSQRSAGPTPGGRHTNPSAPLAG